MMKIEGKGESWMKTKVIELASKRWVRYGVDLYDLEEMEDGSEFHSDFCFYFFILFFASMTNSQ